MKKFCDKITKQQWRVTVPNINTSLFKKSANSSKELTISAPIHKKKSHGSYDLQSAQMEFEKTKSVVSGPVYSDANDSESDSYEDARENPNSEKCSSGDELEVYADVYPSQKSEISKSPSNNKFEYDVPKISFSFFDDPPSHEYQIVNIKQKEETSDKQITMEEEPTKGNANFVSEVKIELALPQTVSDTTDTSDHKFDKLSKSDTDIKFTEVERRMKPFNKNDSSSTILLKSNSDPSLSNSQNELEQDDCLYKVPGPARRYRFTQSLTDLNRNLELISSTHSSIEHISCSQVFAAKQLEESLQNSATNSTISPTRRKFPFFHKPKSKTWVNLRTKLNNLMVEQAATQRVGYFTEKDHSSVKIEEMYKSSKDKCKKMWKTTGKLLVKSRRELEHFTPNSSLKMRIATKVPKRFNASDIEHNVNSDEGVSSSSFKSDKSATLGSSKTTDDETQDDVDSTMKYNFMRSKNNYETPSGFEDLRKYVKQGGDFCKELATILQERSDAELQYAKSLQKLSVKLSRACREGVGGLNDAWGNVAIELETQAEAHKILGNGLLEDTVRPLKNINDCQHKIRKQTEIVVDKASKALADWRITEGKSKKNSHACCRDNEKMQDSLHDVKLSKTSSLIHMHNQKVVSEKESTKLEAKRRKADESAKKADIEYYTLCVRTERARLEWESAVLKGTNTFQTLEEERLNNLKSTLTSYLHHLRDLGPRLIETTERLSNPVKQAEPTKDLMTFMSIRNTSQQTSEQLLPDFYCEHITLAMNRERRKQALLKLLQLIRQDIERERKSKHGLENLSKAMKETPSFGAEESQQNVCEKLFHMKSMLTYLEGSRYKLQNSLGEIDSRPRTGHPLAPHITITRDKAGLQQSILKAPQWLREELLDADRSPVSVKSMRCDRISDSENIESDWMDRGAADGNSNQPDSDFDEFSSQGSSTCHLNNIEENAVQPISYCKALYAYTPNLPDELTLHPGDTLSVYRKQEDGWWLGECNGSVGIFPATYVEVQES